MNSVSRFVAVVVIAAAALGAAACGGKKDAVDTANVPVAKPQWQTLTGVLVYRERMLLPPGVTGVVVLTDAARYGDESARLGEVDLKDLVAPPMPFAITYDASRLVRGGRYGLRATLYDENGKPFFATPELYLVDLDEGPPLGGVEVMLRRAGPSSAPATP